MSATAASLINAVFNYEILIKTVAINKHLIMQTSEFAYANSPVIRATTPLASVGGIQLLITL